MKKNKWLIPLMTLTAVAPIAALAGCSCHKNDPVTPTEGETKALEVSPVLNSFTDQGTINFHISTKELPKIDTATGKRFATLTLVNVTNANEIELLSTTPQEVSEDGFVSFAIKVKTASKDGLNQFNCKVTLKYTDESGKDISKEFTITPTYTKLSDADKAKMVIGLDNYETDGNGTITGVKTSVSLTGKTTLVIPNNYSVQRLALSTGAALSTDIKTVIFLTPTEPDSVGLQKWYNVLNGAFVNTSIDTIVLPDFTNKNLIGFEDYAIDYDYDSGTGVGSHTNVKTIDISSWSRSTIRNIDRYAGGYLGQPFYDMTEAKLILPSTCETDSKLKSGIYRILKSGQLYDDLLANNNIKPTISFEEGFKFAKFDDLNKIIIGTDPTHSWDTTRVYIPAGTTDIIPFAFYEYDGTGWYSSFTDNVQVIDFSKVPVMNSIGSSILQNTYVSGVANFPTVTSGCASCLACPSYIKNYTIYQSYIKYISVADGVKTVPFGAFALTGNLTTCHLPESVTNIEEAAFYFASYDHASGQRDVSSDPYIALTVNMPSNLIEIDDFAFYQSNISKIKFPKSLKKLGKNAFECREVSNVPVTRWRTDILWCLDFTEFDNFSNIPTGWNNEEIFKNHKKSALTKIAVVNENVEQAEITKLATWLETNGGLGNGNYRIMSQKTLSTSDLTFTTTDNSVTITGINSTLPVAALYKLEIPATINGKPVKAIADGAFEFDDLSTPAKLYKISSISFENATNLETIGIKAFNNQSTLVGDIVLPSTIKSVGGRAFNETNIESLTLNANSSGCTYGNDAFQGCRMLSTIEVSPNAGNIELAERCFYFCEGLQYLQLSPKITKMGQRCFGACLFLWYLDLEAFGNDSAIPTGWEKLKPGDARENPGAFGYAFDHVIGYYDTESTPARKTYPCRGVLDFKKGCTKFAEKFRYYLTVENYNNIPLRYDGYAILSVDEAFVSCFGE